MNMLIFVLAPSRQLNGSGTRDWLQCNFKKYVTLKSCCLVFILWPGVFKNDECL